jgi:hypothetical protein
VLLQRHPQRALDDLERVARGCEEHLARARADPERPANAAGDEDRLRLALVEPGGGHRAVELLERARVAPPLLGEREDRLRVDGHRRVPALPAVAVEELLVVLDDAVVDPDDRAVADRVVVGLDRGVALRVVPHVHEHLAGARRDVHAVEQPARAAALLDDVDPRAYAPEGVSGRIGAAFGDPGQQGLRRQRPVDGRLLTQAVTSDATHTKTLELSEMPRPISQKQ